MAPEQGRPTLESQDTGAALQHQLQNVYAQPLAKLQPDFLQHANMLEAEGPIEVQAFIASFRNTRDERMKLDSPRFLNDRLLELPPNSFPAMRRMDIERSLGCIPISQPIRPRSQRRPTHNFPFHLSDEDRMAFAMSFQPPSPLFNGLRLGIKRGRCRQDGFVVDLGDDCGISKFGPSDHNFTLQIDIPFARYGNRELNSCR